MQPQDNQNIWISREEYDRLRKLEYDEASRQHSQKSDIEVAVGADSQSASKSNTSILAIITALLALLSFIFPPFLLLFLILGVVTMIQAVRSRSKKTAGIVGILLTTVILFTIAPFLFLIMIFTFWSLGCQINPGECRSA